MGVGVVGGGVVVAFTLKVACALRGPFITTLQVATLPLQAPVQPSKVCVALFQLARAVAVVPRR